MNSEFYDVKDFNKKFNHPYSDVPTLLNKDRVDKRYNWMLEEINEFKDSTMLVDQADAMIDLIYFALGTLVEMGIEPDELFQIVHKANMSKLWEDGKPHYKDGKVIKPSSWEDPEKELIEAINNQWNRYNERKSS